MENKNLVFLPDDVYKELKKIGKDFNDADDDVQYFGKFFDCEKNHFSGKNSRSVIGTVHLD